LRHEPKVPLRFEADTLVIILEGEESYQVICHKLGGYRFTCETGEFRSSDPVILQDLNNTQPISTAAAFPTRASTASGLGLDRNHVVRAAPVQTDIKIIRFDLSHVRYRSSQVALQGIGHDASKEIDQAVVPEPGKQGLLVT
jgi:hypothetical protein